MYSCRLQQLILYACNCSFNVQQFYITFFFARWVGGYVNATVHMDQAKRIVLIELRIPYCCSSVFAGKRYFMTFSYCTVLRFFFSVSLRS